MCITLISVYDLAAAAAVVVMYRIGIYRYDFDMIL